MKTGLAALDTIPTGGVYQIICFIGLGELGFSTIQEDLEDFCASKYPSLATEKRMAVELNNGRAAQMGILALMVHEKLNNDPYIINSLLGSPGIVRLSLVVFFVVSNCDLPSFFVFIVPFNV